MTFDDMKRNLKERFLWFDTLLGIIKVGYCASLAYYTHYELQYAIQIAFYGASIYGATHGFYQIFSNPVKQEIAVQQMIEERENAQAVA